MGIDTQRVVKDIYIYIYIYIYTIIKDDVESNQTTNRLLWTGYM